MQLWLPSQHQYGGRCRSVTHDAAFHLVEPRAHWTQTRCVQICVYAAISAVGEDTEVCASKKLAPQSYCTSPVHNSVSSNVCPLDAGKGLVQSIQLVVFALDKAVVLSICPEPMLPSCMHLYPRTHRINKLHRYEFGFPSLVYYVWYQREVFFMLTASWLANTR